MGFFKRLFSGTGGGLGLDELARRLEVSENDLKNVRPDYHEFHIPKRGGGTRTIHAPDRALKALQRRLVRRVLSRLRVHPCVTGFEPGYSIVSNAACHVGKAVLVRMDIKDFFGSTTAERVRRYFRFIGWDREASQILETICCHQGGLPQGAPTSPKLSNLVNYIVDERLSRLAEKCGVAYTRYADDLTFSFADDDRAAVHHVIRGTKSILAGCGYRLHQKKKLRIRRQHQRQIVTGLVTNRRVAIPRERRRFLRAVEHRLRHGMPASLSEAQLQGWKSFVSMVERQREAMGR